jgi:hypothetical protein
MTRWRFQRRKYVESSFNRGLADSSRDSLDFALAPNIEEMRWALSSSRDVLSGA